MRRRCRVLISLCLGLLIVGTLVFASGDNLRTGNRDKNAKREGRVKGKAPRFFEGIPEETVKEGLPPRGVSKYTYVTVRQVTTSSNHDRQPSWSPDGQEIVFVSSPVWYAWSCYKINQDGTGLSLLGPGYAEFGNEACYRMPSFSPDGSKILYSLWDSTLGRGNIWMMNSDGSGKQRVSPFDFTDCRSRPGACWSNDGNTVYYRYHYDNHLYSCQVGTGVEVNLTSGFIGIRGCVSRYSAPKVSPNGEWILFRNWNSDPALIDTSGTTYIAIDDLRGDARRQDWSPDGSKIVYESDRLGNEYMDLWIANSDGTGQAPLLQSDTVCFLRPAWSPNGKWIIYIRRGNVDDIWVTSINGLYQGNLSCQYDGSWECRSTPEWNATGDRIVFDAMNNSSDMDIYVIDLDTGDNDLDALLNWEEEAAYGTLPNNPDTDGGGEWDGSEIANGRDPFNPNDDVTGLLPYDAGCCGIPNEGDPDIVNDTLVAPHVYDAFVCVCNNGPPVAPAISFVVYYKLWDEDGNLVGSKTETVWELEPQNSVMVYFQGGIPILHSGLYTAAVTIQTAFDDPDPGNNVTTREITVVGGIKTGVDKVPNVFALRECEPNPVTRDVIIRYEIPKEVYVSLKIYEAMGRLVTTLIEETQSAGYYGITWKPTHTGVYFVKFSAGDFKATKRLLAIR